MLCGRRDLWRLSSPIATVSWYGVDIDCAGWLIRRSLVCVLLTSKLNYVTIIPYWESHVSMDSTGIRLKDHSQFVESLVGF